ncbi:MAG: sigma-70 family RNA polymerase sigma factor [Bacteroidota bacterium]
MYSTKLHTFSDLELVNQYKLTSDNACIGVLFQRYTHLIFGVCVKYLKDEDDAEDASMQIFEKLLTDLKKHEVQQFKAWLHMVCKNYCLMQLRSGATRLKHDKEMHKDLAGFMESEQDLHLTVQNTKEIQLTYMEECMKGLNAEQKLCIELFFLQEKSYQEVTETTNFTMNNVKSYIQNGKRNLKNCIDSRTK